MRKSTPFGVLFYLKVIGSAQWDLKGVAQIAVYNLRFDLLLFWQK